MEYVIGSRGSKLALIQTEYVQKSLQKAYPMHRFSIRVIQTKGDKVKNQPLHKIGGKGLFVKEIEEKILSGEIHMGVHSMKDMPASAVPGLVFTKPWKREDPRDALVLRNAAKLSELKKGAVIATGSKRRAYQLKQLRPDFNIVGIRGNVDTRLRKMEEQKLDGLVLAAAGLHRLGLEHKIAHYFDENEMIPAPAQGVLALEIREDQIELKQMLDSLSHEQTVQEVLCERTFLQKIGGDCHMPVGARCKKIHDKYHLDTVFGDETGKKLVTVRIEGDDPLELADQAVEQTKKKMAGMVFLVGAGPGDPELITVKGREIIKGADCIIYDRLIPEELLKACKKECEKIYVGKRNHHHVMKQEQINELLVQKAFQYNRVVRLKGGDSYVFGRGGEEGLFLAAQGIPFQVIPGISSCIAAPESAGIPVTHRGISTGFHVVTAHNQKDQLADLDYAALARTKETLIFLMGLSKLSNIMEKLHMEGMSLNTPVAVISNALRPEQKVCEGTLENITEKVLKANLISPAVIVVGDVVRLRESLKEKTVSGYHLVTKTGSDPSRLTKLLKREGILTRELQLGEICLRQDVFTADELKNVHYLVFTSRHGVRGFMCQIRKMGLDIRRLFGIQIAAVGGKTADTLNRYGIVADIVPEIPGEKNLAAVLKEQISKDDILWHVKGTMGGESLREVLSKNCNYEEKIIYENIETKVSEIPDIDRCNGISFTSASAARRFFQQADAGKTVFWKENMPLFSIGSSTTKELRLMGGQDIRQAQEATYESMVRKIKESWLTE